MTRIFITKGSQLQPVSRCNVIAADSGVAARVRVAQASRLLVLASRQNELFSTGGMALFDPARFQKVRAGEDARANRRDACATHQLIM